MGIEDGDPGLAISGIDGGSDRLPESQLFPDPLEDQDVTVHRQANGERNPGNPRQSQGRLYPRQYSHHHDEIEEKG